MWRVQVCKCANVQVCKCASMQECQLMQSLNVSQFFSVSTRLMAIGLVWVTTNAQFKTCTWWDIDRIQRQTVHRSSRKCPPEMWRWYPPFLMFQSFETPSILQSSSSATSRDNEYSAISEQFLPIVLLVDIRYQFRKKWSKPFLQSNSINSWINKT